MVKISAIYFIVLAILYLVQSLVCLYQLSADDFLDQFTKQYAIEVYEYSIQIERMKVVHALSIGSIAVATLIMTRKFKMLNGSHYCQLMTMSLLVTILYFVPILYVGWIGYTEVGEGYVTKAKWESSILRFADWFYMIMKRTDMGMAGFII